MRDWQEEKKKYPEGAIVRILKLDMRRNPHRHCEYMKKFIGRKGVITNNRTPFLYIYMGDFFGNWGFRREDVEIMEEK